MSVPVQRERCTPSSVSNSWGCCGSAPDCASGCSESNNGGSGGGGGGGDGGEMLCQQDWLSAATDASIMLLLKPVVWLSIISKSPPPSGGSRGNSNGEFRERHLSTTLARKDISVDLSRSWTAERNFRDAIWRGELAMSTASFTLICSPLERLRMRSMDACVCEVLGLKEMMTWIIRNGKRKKWQNKGKKRSNANFTRTPPFGPTWDMPVISTESPAARPGGAKRRVIIP